MKLATTSVPFERFFRKLQKFMRGCPNFWKKLRGALKTYAISRGRVLAITWRLLRRQAFWCARYYVTVSLIRNAMRMRKCVISIAPEYILGFAYTLFSSFGRSSRYPLDVIKSGRNHYMRLSGSVFILLCDFFFLRLARLNETLVAGRYIYPGTL